MAHISRDEIDVLAAEQVASEREQAEGATGTPEKQVETTLAYGAGGDCLKKLVDLLVVGGYGDVTLADKTTLDADVAAAVAKAQQELAVSEPELTLPSDIPVGVKASPIVGQATWDALYAAAEAKVAPAPESVPPAVS